MMRTWSLPRTACAAGLIASAIALPLAARPAAHDVTTVVTWNREISRIVFARCAPCHRAGGSAFSLLSYAEVSPWAKAIKETVLQRTMPPWGAVKGFGDFRNDQALTQEELDLFEKWANGGAPEGNPNDVQSRPRVLLPPAVAHRPDEIVLRRDARVDRAFVLDGFWVRDVPEASSAQITIEFPDGRIEPLVWLHDYSAKTEHPFLLRRPLSIPAGAIVRGLPANASLVLLPLAK